MRNVSLALDTVNWTPLLVPADFDAQLVVVRMATSVDVLFRIDDADAATEDTIFAGYSGSFGDLAPPGTRTYSTGGYRYSKGSKIAYFKAASGTGPLKARMSR